jgi:hypothetical protein
MLLVASREDLLKKLHVIKGMEKADIQITSTSVYAGGSNVRVTDSTNTFSFNLFSMFGMCGICYISTYILSKDRVFRQGSIKLFDEMCKLLHEKNLIGAIIGTCYTAASMQSSLMQGYQILTDLGFEIVSWYNNPAHIKVPTEKSHWISGTYIRKLDKFDVGLTKEQMQSNVKLFKPIT